MLFCTERFVVFFLLVFTVYWGLPWRRLCLSVPLPGCRGPWVLRGDEVRVWWLLAASFSFYACWNEWLALVICASTVLDYLLARGMDATSSPRLRKLLVQSSVAINLGLLCYFKYANFFLESLEQALRTAGASASLPVLQVIVPVGISFYTFEAISYTVDVYRRRIPAERNLAHLMLFILFFPHLVSGPIVRARDFLPQAARPKHWSLLRFHAGVELFLLGLLKKWALADRMAAFIDPVFANPGAYGSRAVWVTVLAALLQIYGDFSGYSDMALGCAHLLGYKLAPNFNLPFLAANMTEFWNRWHISLSTWMRDYLLLPLRGRRDGVWRTSRNLLITMTLVGLWHGATWMFVAWGALQGLLLVIHRCFRSFAQRRPRLGALLSTSPGFALRRVLTISLVVLTYVFFRAPDFAVAGSIFRGLMMPRAGRGTPVHVASFWYTVVAVVVFYAVGHFDLWKRFAPRLPTAALGLSYALGLTACLVLAPHSDKVFIYFQF